jgi:hypothetical protein
MKNLVKVSIFALALGFFASCKESEAPANETTPATTAAPVEATPAATDSTATATTTDAAPATTTDAAPATDTAAKPH